MADVLIAIIAACKIVISADLVLDGADFAYPWCDYARRTEPCCFAQDGGDLREDALRQIVEEHKNYQAVMLYRENTASLD